MADFRANQAAVWLLLCALLSPLESSHGRQAVEAGLLEQAERELFAARHRKAAELYAAVLERNPEHAHARYGLVRALLRDRRSLEAHTVADEGLRRNPDSPPALAAGGMSALRRGDIVRAEALFREAVKIDPDYHGGLQGLARILQALSQYKSAESLMLRAYRNYPNDPDLMLAHADTLKGAEHIAALERVLPILDPQSDEALRLRGHLAFDRVTGDKILRRLLSPYTAAKIKLRLIQNGPQRAIGWGVNVRLNDRQSATLLLDTGASGVNISRKIAQRANLASVTGASTMARGIGDDPAPTAYSYLASKLKVDDVEFADYPVSVFESAATESYDGLISPGVFGRFIVRIDFPRGELLLEPRPEGEPKNSDDLTDVGPAPQGFHRVLRLGSLLAVPTSVNGAPFSLFAIDSGATVTVIDTEIASMSASVHRDDGVSVKGIQGEVDKVSTTERVVLRFAGFQQDNASLVAVSLSNVSDSLGIGLGGVLGMPLLAQLTVTLDYRQSAVRFDYKK